MGDENASYRDANQNLPPYPDRFYLAAQYAAVPSTVEVDKAAAHPPKKFSDLTNLLLYSLFQQATQGPCTTPKPWFLNVVESAKWSSWKELGDMAPVEAMRLFVRTLEEEAPDWWERVQQGPGGTGAFPDANGASYDFYEEDAELATELRFVPDNLWEPLTVQGRKPAPRYQHSAVMMGIRLFVVGGNSNGRYLNDIQMLDLSTLTWSKIDTYEDPGEALPSCAGHVLVQGDSRTILSVGGFSKDGEEKIILRMFDLSTRKWSVVKTEGQTPCARGGHSVTRVGSFLWLFGGEDNKRTLLNDVYCLDLENLTWELVETSGARPSPRSDHTATVHAGRYLAVFGGGSHSHCFNDLSILDFETLKWSQPEVGGSTPTGRAGHQGVLVGSRWYIVGGGDNKGGNPETLLMDLDSLTWSVVTTAQPRTSIVSEGLSLVTCGSVEDPLLIAFGGYNGRYSNQVYGFRPGYLPERKPSQSGGPAEPPALVPIPPGGGPVGDAPPGAEAPQEGAGAPAPAVPDEVERQLEEAAEMTAKAEKLMLDARAEAEYVAAKARADAWAVIGKAKLEEEGLKEKLVAALKARAEADLANQEAQAACMQAQLLAQSASAEATKLRKELMDMRHLFAEMEARAAQPDQSTELGRVQKDFAMAKTTIAETEQELNSLRNALGSEQARCFHLEVEVAELRQRLQGMEALEQELDLLRRQKAASDEQMAYVEAHKPPPGVFGWLSRSEQ